MTPAYPSGGRKEVIGRGPEKGASATRPFCGKGRIVPHLPFGEVR